MTLLATLKTMRAGRARKTGRFVLRYSPPGEPSVTVGHLDFDGQTWTFSYDEDYRQRGDLRPIEGFDDLGRTYRSTLLFPFFAVRIPDIDREDVKRTLATSGVRDPEPTDLLRIFGRRVVSSPAFELLPA